MRRVSLNVDLGELEEEPEALYGLATVANVACGGHAGDDSSMARACALARAHGGRVAAHPSYPDRDGFGRRSIAIPSAALRASIAAQCGALRDVARARALAIDVVKPHGALYHDAAKNTEVAAAVLEGAVDALGAPLAFVVGDDEGALARLARARGHTVVHEAFADRGYAQDGSLLPRGTPGALLHDPAAAAAQARALVATGRYDTVCVHGDTEGAVEIARAVRTALEDAGALA
jgi:UPF0271 protein